MWQSKKADSVSNFEIFHLREKSVPCDQLEVKDTVIEFAWEPAGTKVYTLFLCPAITPQFAILSGAGPKLQATFYEIKNHKVGKCHRCCASHSLRSRL